MMLLLSLAVVFNDVKEGRWKYAAPTVVILYLIAVIKWKGVIGRVRMLLFGGRLRRTEEDRDNDLEMTGVEGEEMRGGDDEGDGFDGEMDSF